MGSRVNLGSKELVLNDGKAIGFNMIVNSNLQLYRPVPIADEDGNLVQISAKGRKYVTVKMVSQFSMPYDMLYWEDSIGGDWAIDELQQLKDDGNKAKITELYSRYFLHYDVIFDKQFVHADNFIAKDKAVPTTRLKCRVPLRMPLAEAEDLLVEHVQAIINGDCERKLASMVDEGMIVFV